MASSNSRQFLIILLAVVAFHVPSISAVEFVVGDEKGWTINFDYQAWAQGKQFHVGDKLVFKYPKGVHNVLKVNGTRFNECAAPPETVALKSGYDVIPLATEGRKWYICGVAQHCKVGNQKLFITVLPQLGSPSVAPSPGKEQPSAAPRISSNSGFGLLVIIIGVVGVFFA